MAQTVVFKNGEIIFKEGDVSRDLYIIKKGLVSVFVSKKDAIIELATLKDGDVLGELAFFDGSNRSASAKALVDSEIAVVSYKDVNIELKKLPNWLQLIITSILARIRSANDKLKALENISAATTAKLTKKAKVEPLEVLKILSLIYLVFNKYGTEFDDGILIDATTLDQMLLKIFNVPQGKYVIIIDILKNSTVLTMGDNQYTLVKSNTLFGFIKYFEEQQSLDVDQRLILKESELKILELFLKYKANEEDVDVEKGIVRAYIEDILENIKQKENLNITTNYFDPLVDLGLLKNKMVYRNNKIGVDYNKKDLSELLVYQKIINLIYID